MGSFLNAIFNDPIVLLGICFIIIGAASLLSKVFDVTKAGNKYVKGNAKKTTEPQNSKKVFVFILIAILIVFIVFMYWLRK